MNEAILNASFLPESAGGPQLNGGEVHVWAVPLHGARALPGVAVGR